METSNEKNEILEIVDNLKPIFKLVKNNNKFLIYIISIIFFSWYLNPIIKESRIKNICAFTVVHIRQKETALLRNMEYKILGNKLGLKNAESVDVQRFCQIYL
jgi:uncharacterized membrane protein